MKHLFWVSVFVAACGPTQVSKDTDAPPPDAAVTVDAPEFGNTDPVNVLITADNAYGFGYGTDVSIDNYFGGIENADARSIFYDPESYVVPADAANKGDYLYIMGWSDDRVTQGVLAAFTRGDAAVYSGAGDWFVCATGLPDNYGAGGPSLVQFQQGLNACNAKQGLSEGWRNSLDSAPGRLAVGEENDTTQGDTFPNVPKLPQQAKWMWYEHNGDTDPFRTGSSAPGKEFILFRLEAERVQIE